ncbi:hypothetical protein GJ496_007061 [Pomphorhynchus laevis]|nr:hypothetical protein GJ496_007061 [Pomphorhynchus laevis]
MVSRVLYCFIWIYPIFTYLVEDPSCCNRISQSNNENNGEVVPMTRKSSTVGCCNFDLMEDLQTNVDNNNSSKSHSLKHTSSSSISKTLNSSNPQPKKISPSTKSINGISNGRIRTLSAVGFYDKSISKINGKSPHQLCNTEGDDKLSTISNGIDDDSFKIAFQNTKALPNFTARDLRPQIESIKEILHDPNNDWEKRFDALKRLRSLIHSKANELPDFKVMFKQLEIPLQTTLKDLRSQLVRESCITISYMAQNLEVSQFDHMAENLIPYLQLLIQNSAKVMSNSAILTIKYILKYTQSHRLIPLIIAGMSSKSKDIRRQTCKFIYRILLEWPVEIWSKYVSNIQEAIKLGIEDADVNARMYSRSSFFVFQNVHPSQAEQLFNSLDQSKKKILKDDMNFSTSKLSISSSDSVKASKINTLSYLPSKRSLDQNVSQTRTNTPKPPNRFRIIRGSRTNQNLNNSNKVSSSQPGSRTTSPTHRFNESIRQNRYNQMGYNRSGSMTHGSLSIENNSTNGRHTPGFRQDAYSQKTVTALQTPSDDDNFSLCSDPSSQNSHQTSFKLNEVFNESIQMLSSNQWDQKHEGLSRIRRQMFGRTFSKTEIKKLVDNFIKLFTDAHGKTLVLFLDVLAEFIERYFVDLNDYFDQLLTGLLLKSSLHDTSTTTGVKVQHCLEILKKSFDCSKQLTATMNILVDESMILKMKLAVLRLLYELLNSKDCPNTFSNCPDLVNTICCVLRMTSDKKSGDLRRISQKVLATMYSFNSVEFNDALLKLSKEYKMTAANVLKSRSKGGFSSVYMSLDNGPISQMTMSSTLRKSTLKRAHTPAEQREQKNGAHNLSIRSASPVLKSLQRSSPSMHNGHLQNYDSEELLTDFSAFSLSTKKPRAITDQEQLECLSPLIIQIAQQQNSVEIRYQSMQSLMNFIHDINDNVWNEHFDTILLLMIRTLLESHVTLQICALRILENLLRFHSERFSKYIELTIFKLLECQSNAVGSTEFINPVIEETIRTCAASLPAHNSLSALIPIVKSTDRWPMQLAAIKMMEQVIEISDSLQIKEYASDMCNALISAWESEHSSIRKATVFCFVAIHSRAGESTLQPIMEALPNNKLKLLNVYIKRRECSNTNKVNIDEVLPTPS